MRLVPGQNHQRPHGPVPEVQRRQPLRGPPNDPGRHLVAVFYEPHNEATVHDGHRLVGHRRLGPGAVPRDRHPERAGQPARGIEQLGAHETGIVGHQGIADRGTNEIKALEFPWPLSEPARTPLEGARCVVAPQLRRPPVRDDDVTGAQARGCHDFAELVFGCAADRPDLDERLRFDRPALAGRPQRRDSRGYRDSGRVGVYGVY